MADLFSTITDKAILDKSQIEVWQQGVILASKENTHFYPGSPLISQSQLADTSVATFLKFSQLSSGTSALTDGVEVTSEAVTDAEVNFVLAEYGNVVTTTILGHVATGGRLNPATARLVGQNMGTSMDKLAIQALEASTNELTVNAGGEAATTANDIITDTFIDKAYNKLRRANVEPLMDGSYVAVMHPDVLYDLKAATSAGDWYDLMKYTSPDDINRSMMYRYKGFIIVESSNVTINADAGNGNVDTYHSIFMGYNALGYAQSTSAPPRPTLVTGTDKLERFVHLGWKGVFKYDIIDSDSLWVVTSGSTVGANT